MAAILPIRLDDDTILVDSMESRTGDAYALNRAGVSETVCAPKEGMHYTYDVCVCVCVYIYIRSQPRKHCNGDQKLTLN